MEPLTWKTLAKKLEVSHQGLHLWRQLEGAPETADLEAWQAFKAERGLGRGFYRRENRMGLRWSAMISATVIS